MGVGFLFGEESCEGTLNLFVTVYLALMCIYIYRHTYIYIFICVSLSLNVLTEIGQCTVKLWRSRTIWVTSMIAESPKAIGQVALKGWKGLSISQMKYE